MIITFLKNQKKLQATLVFLILLSLQQVYTQEKFYEFHNQITYTVISTSRHKIGRIHLFAGDGVYSFVGSKKEIIIDTKEGVLIETDGKYYRESNDVKIIDSMFTSASIKKTEKKQQQLHCFLERKYANGTDEIKLVLDEKLTNIIPLFQFLGLDIEGVKRAGIRYIGFNNQQELKLNQDIASKRFLSIDKTVEGDDVEFKNKEHVERINVQYNLKQYIHKPFKSEDDLLNMHVEKYKKEVISSLKCFSAKGSKDECNFRDSEEKIKDFEAMIRELDEPMKDRVTIHLKFFNRLLN